MPTDDPQDGLKDGPQRELARRLQEGRRQRKLQVAQVERLSGLSHTTVSQALNGRTVPSTATLTALAGVLRLPEAELLELRERAVRADEDGADVCPYPGMEAFGPDRAEVFFGRDELVARLLGALDRRRRSGGIQLVIGASGAGKSSLLRAGLVPRLRAGALDADGAALSPVVLTPTADPVAALDRHLAEDGQDPPAPGAPDRRQRVLVVDQFEEVFTECRDEDRRGRFIDALVALAAPGPGGAPPAARVVVGLRADFYAAFLSHPGLLAAASDAPVTVGPLTPAQLREAITLPATRSRRPLRLEPGLVERLLADLGTSYDDPEPGHDREPDHDLGQDHGVASDRGRDHDPRSGRDPHTPPVAAAPRPPVGYDAGRLPLLAHALRGTWTQRTGDTLTLRGYELTGGIRGAVKRSAEEVWDRLDGPGRLEAQALFLRLIRVERNAAADSRRRADRAALSASGQRPEVLRGVIDAFVAARLLTQYQDTVEITHEVLLRSWPRLRRWADEERACGLVRQDLEDAAHAWLDRSRAPELLYRGVLLKTALADAGTTRGPAAPVTAFLAASVRLDRRTRVLRRGAVTLLAVLALLASTTAGYALRQRAAAQEEADRTVAASIATEADRVRAADGSLAARLDVVAHRTHPTDESRARVISAAGRPLSRALPWDLHREDRLAFAADGTTLLAFRSFQLSDNEDVRAWRVGRERPGEGLELALPPDWLPVRWTSVSQALPLVAVRDDRRRTGLWDIADPTRPRLRAVLDPQVVAVHFAPDAPVMATVTDLAPDHKDITDSDDTRLRLWDIADPARPRPMTAPFGPPGIVHKKVDFADHGRTVAVAGRNGVQLWRVGAHAPPGSPPAPAGTFKGRGRQGLTDFALRPDGQALAVVVGGRAELRRLDGGRPEVVPLGGAGANGGAGPKVGALAYSRDGTWLATTDEKNRTVQLWDDTLVLPSPTLLPLTGHTAPIEALAFAPDGRSLAVRDEKEVRLWTLPAGIPTRWGYRSPVALAYRPDGRLLLYLGRDPVLWDTADPLRPRFVARLGTGYALSAAFAPDGRTLYTTTGSGEAEIWDVGSPRAPRRIGAALEPGPGDEHMLSLSADGRLLAVTAADVLSLWDVSDPQWPRFVRRTPQTRWAVFAPQGRTLVTSSALGVQVWDVRDPAAPKALRGFVPATEEEAAGAGPAVFATASRVLLRRAAQTDEEAGLWIWDTARPAGPDNPYAVPVALTGPVYSVAVRQGLVAIGGPDGRLRQWHLEDGPPGAGGAPLRALGGPLTGHTEDVRDVFFAPHGEVLASADFGGVLLWPLDTDVAVRRVCAATEGALTADRWRSTLPGLDRAPECD
ncbi:helix-turn-helix domain-containing protein [Streptomyces sp. NPDC089919]|uniref:nSTAND1 domain-containing NTPase n=1 Tax=Streptomyces sp. NPDC089919 TaxID=3155188 RepID=UPI00343A9AC3